MNESDMLLDNDTAAYFVSAKPQTLIAWRMLGKGPPYVRIGRSIRYRKSDLVNWLEEQTVRPGKRELATA